MDQDSSTPQPPPVKRSRLIPLDLETGEPLDEMETAPAAAPAPAPALAPEVVAYEEPLAVEAVDWEQPAAAGTDWQETGEEYAEEQSEPGDDGTGPAPQASRLIPLSEDDSMPLNQGGASHQLPPLPSVNRPPSGGRRRMKPPGALRGAPPLRTQAPVRQPGPPPVHVRTPAAPAPYASRPVVASRHPASSMTLLWVLIAIVGVVLAYNLGKTPVVIEAGQTEFEKATGFIATDSLGVALGNNDSAKKLSAAWRAKIKELEDAYVQQPENTGFLVPKLHGEMVTYCLINGNNIAFLVNVPNLMRLSPQGQAAMGTLAWNAAQVALNEGGFTQPKKVAVGVRGSGIGSSGMYDSIKVGDMVVNPKKEGDGVLTNARGDEYKKLIFPYFITGGVTGG